MRKKRILLCSGGIDSALMVPLSFRDAHTLEWAVSAMFVDYGQPAKWQEEKAARALCDHYRIPLLEVEVSAHLGDMETGVTDASPCVVPARNLILISLAANHRADEIWIGCNQDDQRDYADCRAPFIDDLAELLDISIRTPLRGMTKGTVHDEAKRLEVPVDLTWSCYRGGPNPCGKCASCRT